MSKDAIKVLKIALWLLINDQKALLKWKSITQASKGNITAVMPTKDMHHYGMLVLITSTWSSILNVLQCSDFAVYNSTLSKGY